MASGRLILPLTEPVLDSSGDIAPGATLTVYTTGTTNLASLFADTGLSQAITNPQTSDAAGRFYAQASAIYADPGSAYDCKLTLPDGETFTWDGITLLAVAAGGGGAFMPVSGGTFTGPVSGPTPAANDDSNLLATTAFVQTLVSPLAQINSPAFTGIPTAPQPAASGAPANQLATVAFAESVAAGLSVLGTNVLSFTVGSVVVNGGYSAGPYGEQTVQVTLETDIDVTGPFFAGGATYIPGAPVGQGDAHTTRMDVVAVANGTASFYVNRNQSNDPNISGFYWWVVGKKPS